MMHDGTMSTGGWILMTFFWLVLLAVIVFLIVQLLPDRGTRRDDAGASADDQDRPETILARRLARGEIDEATYDRLRDKITRSPTTTGGR
jgi:uncharacterized membrane protein